MIWIWGRDRIANALHGAWDKFTGSAGPSLAALPTDNPWVLSRWMAAAYACIALALLGIVAMAGWGVYHDLELVRTTLLQSEINRLHSHVVRSAGLIETELQAVAGPTQVSDVLRKSPLTVRFREGWDRTIFNSEPREYSAVTDVQGKIVFHSHIDREGQQLGPNWYQGVVNEAGTDVVETANPALTGGVPCLDVRAPIFDEGTEVGAYHTGLNLNWLNRELQKKQTLTWQRWGVIFCFMVLLVSIAGTALFYISRRLTMFQETVKLNRVRRFAELGQLMAGIAHEIRNPLNAMRLNLHVLTLADQRSRVPDIGSDDDMPEIDRAAIIRETNQEIERVEELIGVLLGYAQPDRSHEEDLDVAREIQSILSLIKPALENAEVTVHLHFPQSPAVVHMDRDRFRQVILNLLDNAKEATPAGGSIHATVAARMAIVEIVVADDGPGVSAINRERVFEPFFTTKELGTGLGLALVRRFVEEVGGAVSCQPNLPRGARFTIRLAQVSATTDAPIVLLRS
jgi:signal transduction histidine kinase